jgi:hypothetical protein
VRASYRVPGRSINTGLCDEFAWAVSNTLAAECGRLTREPIGVYETPFDAEWPAHVWVRFRRRSYDAEWLAGVQSFRSLPLFRRAEVAGRCRPVHWA